MFRLDFGTPFGIPNGGQQHATSHAVLSVAVLNKKEFCDFSFGATIKYSSASREGSKECIKLLSEISSNEQEIAHHVYNTSLQEGRLVLLDYLQATQVSGMSERDDRHKRLRQCCNADGMHVFTCSERAEEVSKVLQKIKTAISSYKEQAVNLQRKLNILGLLQERGGFCTIDDILTVCEITDYNAALMWVKHLKRNLLLGKHVLPICVLNPPKKTPPSLRRNLTVVALNTFQSHEETHKKAIAFQSRLCRQYKISTKEDFSLKPDVEKMKETIGLIGCEKTKKIVKNLLMDSGFSEAYLHRKLNFRYSALRNAKVQVSNAKESLKMCGEMPEN
ncbi:hypothetical protein OS493_000131 [Desmophyllum pertusum]|uniref:Uncharacterized protein n=1 Tax=Desmophyllum pertusum TaxID=174260 RepID=A0A9X0A6P2_9CNID|nr:hypothetical protein OS493_000131 [Desmophyllum pertusum]